MSYLRKFIYMNIKFIFLLILILVSSCIKKLTINEVTLAGDGRYYYQGKPFSGQVFDLHENGKLKFEMNLIDGKKDGPLKKFNESSKLIEQENYDHGLKHGIFLKYFNDGRLEHQKIYIRDTMDGQWIIHDGLYSINTVTYKMGVKEGYYKSVDPYGDIEGTFHNNLEVGVWKEYDFYKRLISEKEYKKGILDGTWRTYDPQTGLVLEEGLYKNGRFINKGKDDHKSVKIGTQTWMAENLNSICFQNGDTLSSIDYQYYRNDPQNYAKKYGVFYNWKTVTDPRNICPDGYRIPTKSDWELLLKYLGENAFRKLKSSTNWEKYYGVSGTNESGMNVLPIENNSAFFWSSTEMEEGYAWGISFGGSEYIISHSKKNFETCRCIRK